MKIVVTENIRIDDRDYTADQAIAKIDSDIPLQTLAQMCSMGQARIEREPKTKPTAHAGVPTSVGDRAPAEPESPTDDEPELTNASAIASFGVSDRLVDLLLANEPSLITKADVIKFLETNKDLTPVHDIGKKSSDTILTALGLK